MVTDRLQLLAVCWNEGLALSLVVVWRLHCFTQSSGYNMLLPEWAVQERVGSRSQSYYNFLEVICHHLYHMLLVITDQSWYTGWVYTRVWIRGVIIGGLSQGLSGTVTIGRRVRLRLRCHFWLIHSYYFSGEARFNPRPQTQMHEK
jgi:hypothetical protein